MKISIVDAISRFGMSATAKLSSPVVTGEPEDQLRAPFELLLADIAALVGLGTGTVVAVGESTLSELKTRPDYAVTVHGTLTGFIELKAPGKGGDPRKFKNAHDKAQWSRLRSLPNLIYTDGNEFSLWQEGELAGSVIRLDGYVETSGSKLSGGLGLPGLFESFLQWQPTPPASAKDLARITARLCRLLRDEVTEQLELKGTALTNLASGWRKLLFPDATNERFADGYAQAVTFGLLMARAKGISVTHGLHQVSEELGKTNSLIGAALHLLTDDQTTRDALKTSLGTLERVLEVVDWQKISKGSADAWLYFYEDFLEVYDNTLRKLTGSYYTPAEVVECMVRLVDETLNRPGFNLHTGLASPSVIVADPATGTGTYLLGILRRIAAIVEADQGPGAVKGAVQAALQRLMAFEMQLGPFAVAQLRIMAEVLTLTGTLPQTALRMFVTDTLAHPDDDEGWVFGPLAPIAEQRKAANKIKRDEPITVVIGNPPYKEKALGRGGWVEGITKAAEKTAPLAAWMPPAAWGAGAHSKHLRNLYVYFWRWATWKVFDQPGENAPGIVCFITVAGFLGGPGFQGMRAYLRRVCNEVWVIDCSPEGHQPEVATRIFQGVQQPVCIVLASRSVSGDKEKPAAVRWRALPLGPRQVKFDALRKIRLADDSWVECASEARAPFLPAATSAWTDLPPLEDFFLYNGSGVMPGRTWVIAPDADSLQRRWERLVKAPVTDKEKLFHPHMRGGKLGDKHSHKVVKAPLAGFPVNSKAVAAESGAGLAPVRYGYRSFDRQWIIPDARLINQPNPQLWTIRSNRQAFITALAGKAPTAGPALTVSALIPDLDHYKGSFGGRAFPLWADAAATMPNLRPALLAYLSATYGAPVGAEDLFAYIAALAAHPAYVERFATDLATPGLRIPLTADAATFAVASALGRQVIWLHTYGERMSDLAQGRPAAPPRLPTGQRPQVPLAGTIPSTPEGMPNSIGYDASKQRLLVGSGWVEQVPQEVWQYEVSGKQVLKQWFSYRAKSRERPIIGDRRPPSPLGNIQPEAWLAEYTTELLDLLNVLGLLVKLEPEQAAMLDRVCAGVLITTAALRDAGAFTDLSHAKTGAAAGGTQVALFDGGTI